MGRNDGADKEFEIFLYNGSDIFQITEDSYYDQHPQINDNGYVVWQRRQPNTERRYVYFYDISHISNISGDPGGLKPQINNKNHVVWYRAGECNHYDEILLAKRNFLTPAINLLLFEGYPN